MDPEEGERRECEGEEMRGKEGQRGHSTPSDQTKMLSLGSDPSQPELQCNVVAVEEVAPKD